MSALEGLARSQPRLCLLVPVGRLATVLGCAAMQFGTGILICVLGSTIQSVLSAAVLS